MLQKESFNKNQQKLLLHLKPTNKNENLKPNIIINEEIDLNSIPLEVIINEKLLNFDGEYYKKLYSKVISKEKEEYFKKSSNNNNTLFRFWSKNSDLFQIDEVVFKKIKKFKRKIKSDNEINKSIIKNEQILNDIKNISNFNTHCFKIDRIHFEIKYETKIGQSLSVIGSIDKLGNWIASKALNMNWNEGNIWKANMEYDDIKNFEYKFIFLECGNLKKWEDGINRIFSFSQIKNLFEPNLVEGNIIEVNYIMNQSIKYNNEDFSLTIISEWNKKSM